MFCCYLTEACSFPMNNRKDVDLDERGGREELIVLEGGELYFDYIA